jgi:hypothetical protein
MNPYMQQLLEGYYLDMGNPYAQAMEDQIYSGYERGLSPIMGAHSEAGMFGSGSLDAALVMANEGYNRDLQGMYGNLWENERNRMLQGLGMYSAENQAARGTLGGVEQSHIQAAAQRAAANIAAKAQIEAANIAASTAANALGFQRQQAQFGNTMDLYGLAAGQNAQAYQDALAPYMGLDQAMGVGNMLATFGTQHQQTTGTSPGAGVNPFAQGLMGAMGGGMQGAVMGNLFGGGGNPFLDPSTLGTGQRLLTGG